MPPEMVWEALPDGRPGSMTTIDTKYTDGTTADPLMPGTKRYYRVFAIYGTMGEGAPSAVASATTAPVMAPGTPTALLASTTDPTAATITLTWTVPAATGGSVITGYMIERSADGTTWPTTPLKADTGNLDALSYADMKLMAGTTWHYRVSAINKAGTGLPSDPASATTGRCRSARCSHWIDCAGD